MYLFIYSEIIKMQKIRWLNEGFTSATFEISKLGRLLQNNYIAFSYTNEPTFCYPQLVNLDFQKKKNGEKTMSFSELLNNNITNNVEKVQTFQQEIWDSPERKAEVALCMHF